MAKTKAEKIAAIELQMTQLENQRKKLIQEQKQQERKDRTKRLCKRMGLFESMLPESISLTDEQFQIFLEKTIAAEHSRRILDRLTAQRGAQPPARNAAYTEAQDAIENEDDLIEYLLKNGVTHKEINDSLAIPLRRIQGISKNLDRKEL